MLRDILKLISTAALVLLLQPLQLAAERFDHLEQSGFAIKLPAGWDSLSRSDLSAFNRSAKSDEERAEYGYTPGGRLTTPYILVVTNFDGKLAEPESDDEVDRVLAEESSAEGFKRLLSNTQTAGWYDPQRRIVWAKIGTNVAGFGPVAALSGRILTEEGFVQIMAYIEREHFGKWVPVFRRIIESTEIDAELVYQPGGGALRSLTRDPIAAITLLAAIVAGAYFLRRP